MDMSDPVCRTEREALTGWWRGERGEQKEAAETTIFDSQKQNGPKAILGASN